MLRRFGLPFVTDDAGRARVPVQRGVGGVMAELGDLVAIGQSSDPDEPELLLRLAPEVTLRARVVDATGRPQGGVGVALCTGSAGDLTPWAVRPTRRRRGRELRTYAGRA